jgi:hypothetical protein
MNIFFLDWNLKLCAQYACNRHICKLLIEHTQLLYSVYHLLDPELLLTASLNPYKLTHKNHPCTKWVRENISNFLCLLELTWEYCKEYTFRYDKVHACQEHIIWMIQNLPRGLPNELMTSPAQAMPDKYKCEDSVEAYRKYYIGEKLHFVKYKNREAPEWLESYL